MDPRRRRTNLRLHAALRELLAEMPLEAISIDALCKCAGVTRPTFYAQYSSLTGMLEDYLQSLLDEIEARSEEAHPKKTGADRLGDMSDFMARVFADLDRDDPRLHALIAGVPTLGAEARFAELVERLLEQDECTDLPVRSDLDRRIEAHFYTGAFIGALRLWLSRPAGLTAADLGRAYAELTLFGRDGARLTRDGDD